MIGNLSLRKQQTKLIKCNEIVPHTYSHDGIIRFGDTIILQHNQSNAILACDPFDEIETGEEKYMVTGYMNNSISAKARNTFRITRPPSNLQGADDDNNDPIVHIGQAFCLAANESLLVDDRIDILAPPLFLCSIKKNDRTASKTTNHQVTYMSSVNDCNSIWYAHKPSLGKKNSSQRYLSYGTPLVGDDDVILVHRQTNMYLTCDTKAATRSDFGLEYECYVDRAAAPGKLALMVSEFKGASTPLTLAKPDSPQFNWHFILSDNPSTNEDNRYLPQEGTVEVLLEKIRESIRGKGIDAFWMLRDFLYECENRASAAGKFDREDLKSAVILWGIPFKGKYMDKIIDLLDNQKLGMIDWRQFLRLIRASIPESREYVIKSVYNYLDSKNEGKISFDVLIKSFDPKEHPIVMLGGGSSESAIEQMRKYFQSCVGRSRPYPLITLQLFMEYYSDLSAAVDDDTYFESIVTRNWGYIY